MDDQGTIRERGSTLTKSDEIGGDLKSMLISRVPADDPDGLKTYELLREALSHHAEYAKYELFSITPILNDGNTVALCLRLRPPSQVRAKPPGFTPEIASIGTFVLRARRISPCWSSVYV